MFVQIIAIGPKMFLILGSIVLRRLIKRNVKNLQVSACFFLCILHKIIFFPENLNQILGFTSKLRLSSVNLDTGIFLFGLSVNYSDTVFYEKKYHFYWAIHIWIPQ